MKVHTGNQPKYISKHIANLLHTWNCQEPPVSSTAKCTQTRQREQVVKIKSKQRGIYV